LRSFSSHLDDARAENVDGKRRKDANSTIDCTATTNAIKKKKKNRPKDVERYS
jgi:hypothetical protein